MSHVSERVRTKLERAYGSAYNEDDERHVAEIAALEREVAALRRVREAADKHYPLIAGRVIALERSGETVAFAAWLEAARDISAALEAARA